MSMEEVAENWLSQLRWDLQEATPNITVVRSYWTSAGLSVVFDVIAPTLIVASGKVLRAVTRHAEALPVELGVSLLLNLPDGERLIGGLGKGGPYVLSYEPEVVPGGDPPDFQPWFRSLTGRDFPFVLPANATQHIEHHLFGSDFITPADLRAQRGAPSLPRVLNANVTCPYFALGYWGYGINSYAFYFTRVETNLDLRARIGWGGVYADPEGQDERMFSHLALIEAVLASYKPDRGRLQLYLTSDWVEGVWSPKHGAEIVWKRKPVQDVAAEVEALLR